MRGLERLFRRLPIPFVREPLLGERAMRFAQFRVEGEGALRCRASFRENIVRALDSRKCPARIRIGESRVGARKARIPLRRLGEILHCAVQLGLSPRVVEVAALQVQLIRLEVFGRPLGEAGRQVAPAQTNRQRGRDGTRDLFLHGEDVAPITIVGRRPQHAVVSCVDELGRHLEPLLVPSHGALDQHIHVQRVGDGSDVEILPLERKARRAGDDSQRRNSAERGDEFVREPVGERLVVGIAARADERNHGNRRSGRRDTRRGFAAGAAKRRRQRRETRTHQHDPLRDARAMRRASDHSLVGSDADVLEDAQHLCCFLRTLGRSL